MKLIARFIPMASLILLLSSYVIPRAVCQETKEDVNGLTEVSRRSQECNTPNLKDSMEEDRRRVVYDAWPRDGDFVYIPVFIGTAFSPAERTVIEEGMYELERKTCIVFNVVEDPTDLINNPLANWVNITRDSTGCISETIGFKGGGQFVNLSPEDVDYYTCLIPGIVIHEFMHVLGFVHEHNRPDRDKYIEILRDNIIPGGESQFDVEPLIDTFRLPYDYLSTLHFRLNVNGLSGSPTLRVKNPNVNLSRIGQRDAMSCIDILKIQRMYNCMKTSPPNLSRWTGT